MDCHGYQWVDSEREKSNWYVAWEVVLECKNTIHPWVVIGRARDAHRTPAEVSASVPRAQRLTERDASSYYEITRWDALSLHELPGNPYGAGFVGDQLLRLQLQNKAWSAGNSGVFDSVVYPLAKAVEALAPSEMRGGSQQWLQVCYPILVTTSSIFEIDADAEEPLVTQVPATRIRRSLKSKHLDGTYYIHIVNIDALPDFLSEAKVFMDQVAQSIRLAPEMLSMSRLQPQ